MQWSVSSHAVTTVAVSHGQTYYSTMLVAAHCKTCNKYDAVQFYITQSTQYEHGTNPFFS